MKATGICFTERQKRFLRRYSTQHNKRGFGEAARIAIDVFLQTEYPDYTPEPKQKVGRPPTKHRPRSTNRVV